MAGKRVMCHTQVEYGRVSDAFRTIGKMLGLAAAAATSSYDLSHKLPSAVMAYEKGVLAGKFLP